MSNLLSENLVSDISQFHNSLMNSDEKRKRKASAWIVGDYPQENVNGRAIKKLKTQIPVLGFDDEEEGSCVTSTSCSRVSVQPKSEPSLRAAMIKCRFAETILRAQQKQGLENSVVDVERYKLEAKQEVRKAVQKQREAARVMWVVDGEISWFID